MYRYWMALLASTALAGGAMAQKETLTVPPQPSGMPQPGISYGGDPGLHADNGGYWGDEANGDSPTSRLWLRGEYLLWRFKDGPNPIPEVTTSPRGTLPTLDNPQTRVLFGGNDLEYGWASGVRLSGGTTLGNGRLGVEAGGFVTEQRVDAFHIASDDLRNIPNLGRPFRDVTPGANGREAVFIISNPDLPNQIVPLAGALDIRSSSQLWGTELNVSVNLSRCNTLRTELLAGARYMELEEDLTFTQRRFPTIFPVVSPFTTNVSDIFTAENRFYGGQVGGRVSYGMGALTLEMTGKVALGTTQRKLRVTGQTRVTAPDGTVLVDAPAGFLAARSNTGTFESNDFTVIPEFGLNARYCLRSNIQVVGGYTFLYWDNVFRPGNQIDRTVNATQAPALLPGVTPVPPARPASVLSDSNFWAQGFNLGLEVRY